MTASIWNPAATATVFDATSIPYLPAGTGAVSTYIANKLKERVSVKDFGAAGDGVTDDTSAIQLAVTYALSVSAVVEWPKGNYITSASINNFHLVKHEGSGILKRGSNSWVINGYSGSNYLYIATSGNDSNDGLSSSQPQKTVQSIFNALANWQDALLRNGVFYVVLAAGTYTEGLYISGLKSRNRIVVQGPDVGGSPNTPTAIIDGTSAAAQAGLYFAKGMYVQVQDVLCRNFTLSSVGYGVVVDALCDLYTKNVHATGNQYAGICGDDSSVVRVEGGKLNNNVFYGFRAHDNTDYTVGYHGSVSARTQIQNNGSAGIAILTGSQGHIDYCDLSTNHRNVMLQDNARVHILGSTFTGATIADVVADPTCSWYDDTATVNTFSSSPKFNNPMRSVTRAQMIKTSDASYTQIPELSLTLIGGTTYSFEALVPVSCGAGGVSLALTASMAITALFAAGVVYNGATIVNAQETSSPSGAVGSYTGTATRVVISGTITPTVTGTFGLRFAQNASNVANSAVLVPASLVATVINGSTST